jgi:hypothetical protein
MEPPYREVAHGTATCLDASGELQRHACLADAPGTGEDQEAGLRQVEKRLKLAEQAVTAYEGRRVCSQRLGPAAGIGGGSIGREDVSRLIGGGQKHGRTDLNVQQKWGRPGRHTPHAQCRKRLSRTSVRRVEIA